jgi:sugar/nucleoside kinase (ribokinase family)
LGVIGDDGFAHELTRALNARGISTDLLVRSSQVPTFTYTKLINVATGIEDLPRVDFINAKPLPHAVEQEVIEYLREFATSFDIIFVSDQADTRLGGVVTRAVRVLLEEIASADPKKIVWVDSRIRIERFRHMILKPNEREASAASIGLFGEIDYQRLRTHSNSKLVFVTKGSQGVVVVEDGSQSLVPAFQVADPVDVSGAGDSFSAGAALVLAITGSATEAARFGNLVASITVRKRRDGVASAEEVLAAASQ